ncbi:ultraviolet-B receptor UVR8-like isoform X2 [Vicia villosa]|uniref:ultraviolet-B receptor UVR8-like isoform X2 n=1 Tax=Vicia villosa TaxID=3911 RepID=UPI00273B262F|nr:ultraviolet-B receptor UVR8-like isoform X2 [Vicia villosa]
MEDEVMMISEVNDSPSHVLLISAGASHTVALLSGNVVCSWGRGEDGQLGHGDTDDRLLPTKLSAFDGQDIVSVTCGADYTVARSDSSKNVYSWGWGDFGRLGHGDHSDLFIPHPIGALQGLKIKQIACGDCHCLAVTMESKVLSWGRNQNGELGLGTTEDSLVPQKVLAFEGIRIKMVAAGAEHSVAITEDGDLYGWGWGRYGNLGLGDKNDRLIPEKVNIVGVKIGMVSCGWRHTISVSSSGELYTHGWSKYGQLGHGDFEDHLVPRKVQALSDKFISQVSGGWRHSMALTSSGQLFGWGWNKFGQIGIGNNFDCCSPMLVNFPRAQKVVQISCGWRHTVAVTNLANVYSWGRGTNGQLGHGDTIDRNVPIIIDAFSADGCNGKRIESSKYTSSGKAFASLSERYAVVPNETALGSQGTISDKGEKFDASVPENDVSFDGSPTMM